MEKDLWANRKRGEKCKGCMYFMLKSGVVGRCRRHAPIYTGYPVVFLDDGCGDFKLDEDFYNEQVQNELNVIDECTGYAPKEQEPNHFKQLDKAYKEKVPVGQPTRRK